MADYMHDELDWAIEGIEERLKSLDRADPDRAALLGELASTFSLRADATGDPGDLDRAVDLEREAADLPGADQFRHLMALSAYLHSGFRRSGEPRFLEEAIARGDDAVALVGEDDPRRNLGRVHCARLRLSRWRHIGDIEDLRRANALAQDAVMLTDMTDRNDETDPRLLDALANCRVARFLHAGDDADLEEAISGAERALECSGQRDYERPYRLSNLAALIGTQVDRSLDGRVKKRAAEAVALAEQALELDEKLGSATDRPTLLNTLALCRRASLWRGDVRSSNEIALGSEALALTRPNDVDRPVLLHNLALRLALRFTAFGDGWDLARAVGLCEEALEISVPGDPMRRVYLDTLAELLGGHYSRYALNWAHWDLHVSSEEEPLLLFDRGDPARTEEWLPHWDRPSAADINIAALDRAIQFGEEAREGTRSDDSHLRDRYEHQADRLWMRFKALGAPADLDQAIELRSLAPARPRGLWLVVRWARNGDPGDRDRAIGLEGKDGDDLAKRLTSLADDLESFAVKTKVGGSDRTFTDAVIVLIDSALDCTDEDDPLRPFRRTILTRNLRRLHLWGDEGASARADALVQEWLRSS